MGCYTTIVLKKKDDAPKVNEILKSFGAKCETHNGVEYLIFRTQEMSDEDLRFMNEDTEGLLQMSHKKRPLTKEVLEYFFILVSQYRVKISCPSASEFNNIKALQDWIKTGKAHRFINEKKSENIDRLIDFKI